VTRQKRAFSEIPKLTRSYSNALTEKPGESAETVVANFEADVCDAQISIEEQPLRLIQPHRRDELRRRKTRDLMKHAIEVERADIGDPRHILQRDRFTQPLTCRRDHTFDCAAM
jgi:hypothetical protein